MQNIPVDLETNELVHSLRARYQAASMGAALKTLLLEVLSDDEVAAARKRARLRQEYLSVKG